MKNRYCLILIMLVSAAFSAQAQQVTKTYTNPSSVTIDNVGNYGYTLPGLNFAAADFGSGCQISDVDVIIDWAKTAGTCNSPTGGFSYHGETSFAINGPLGNQILALPNTWSGNATTTNVITTFSQGPGIPSSTPVTGTFGPNNGNLSTYNGQSPYGTWNLRAGDNAGGDPLCVQSYSVRISVATDATPPTISSQSNINLPANSNCQAVATWATPTASDACSFSLSRIAGPPSGSTFGLGSTTITYQALDVFGNSTTTSFQVVVYDNQAPLFNPCPLNIVAVAPNGSCGKIVNFSTPTATDNCSVSVTQILGPGSGSLFPVGSTDVTFRATDGSANTTDCTFSVTIQDTQAPVITCPSGTLTGVANALCVANISYAVTATDNCSAAITGNGGVGGGNFAVGIHNLNFTATDLTGNTDNCSFVVEVTDNTLPVLTCPASFSVNNDPGQCLATVTWADATATDNCGVGAPAQFSGLSQGPNFPIGVSSIVYSATDVNGNTGTCSFNVTVVDNENPTVTCPSNIVVGNDAGFCSAQVTYTIGSSDNCSGAVLVRTQGEASGSSFGVNNSPHTVQYTITDASLNTASCSFTITVDDTEVPVINCPANIVVDNDANLCSAAVSWSQPVGTDNCPGSSTVRTGPAPGSVFDVLTTTTISYLVTDGVGQTASCNFTVTVEDNDVPLVTCPANQNVTFPGCEYLVPDYLGLALVDTADNCAPLVVAQTPAGGSIITEETTVQVSVTDPSGNESICAFTISPLDNTPPTFDNCPQQPDMVNVNSSCQFFMPDYSNLAVSDVCSPTLTFTQSPVAATPLTVTTPVTVTVSDGTNSASCTFDVSPVDAINPTIICPANDLVSVDANCQVTLDDYTGLANTSDNCDVSVDVTQSPTGLVTGNQTITLTATDDAGNTRTCTFQVVVEDDIAPSISCPVSETVSFNATCAYTMQNLTGLATGISDNCAGNVVLSQVPVIGTSIGTSSTVTLYATDASGNVGSCTLSLLIEDNTAPNVVCPLTQTISVDGGCVGTLGDYTSLATATDNCAPANTLVFSQSPAALATFNLAQDPSVPVTISATDGVNTGSCTFTVLLEDVTAPTIVCPTPSPVTANLNCQFSLTNFTGAATVSDNCNPSPSVSQSPAQGTLVQGNTVVTLTATDGDNSASCTFTLTVIYGTNPTISCPTNQSQVADANCAFLLGTYGFMASADDNCDQNVTVTQSPLAGSTQSADVVVTLTATDDASNSSNCTFTVEHVDNAAPSLTCPGNATVDFGAGCTFALANYVGTETTSDNCDPSVTVTQSPAVGTTQGGVTQVTLTAADDDGNQSTCTFNVTPADNTDPTIICPLDQIVSSSIVGQNCVYLIPDLTGAATVSDNCDPSPAVTQSPGVGNVIAVNTTITLTVEDQNNNTAQCTFELILNDDADPSIICPGNLTVQVGTNCLYAIADYTSLAIATDNCSQAPTVSQGTTPAIGSTIGANTPTTITLTATDDNSNTAVCTFTVTAQDVTAPVVTCPSSPVTVSSNSSCLVFLASYIGNATSLDNCDGAGLAIAQSPVAGTAIGGTTQVTLTVVDNSGNIGTCVFDVELDDTAPPTIVCPQNQTVATDGSCGYSLANYTNLVTASDNCDNNITLVQSPAAGAIVSGTTLVTMTVTDADQNSADCSFNVFAEDVLGPVLTNCPPDEFVAVTANCTHIMANYMSDPNYNDNCDATQNLILSQSPLPGALIGGATVVTITATDLSGNSGSCTLLVTPQDNTPPTIFGCPSNITQNNDLSLCGAAVSYATITAIDNCAGVVVPQLDHGGASGSIFVVGTTEVEYIAYDGNGNQTSCVFDITVVDTEDPIIICPSNISINVDANSCGADVTYALPTVTDNCTNGIVPSLDGGIASGLNFPVGTTTNTFGADDGNGNTSSCTFTVTVADNIDPSITCPQSVTVSNDPGNCDAVVSYSLPAAADNCPSFVGPTLLSGGASNTVFALGATTVTYGVVDASSNSATCSFTVTVEDNEDPVLTCPADVSVFVEPTTCQAIVNYGAPSVTDNCNGSIVPTLISGPANGDSFLLGPTVVTFGADDGNGQSVTCSLTVTVVDNEIPEIACPADLTELYNASCVLVMPNYTSLATVSDNCDVSPVVSQSPAVGASVTGGVTIVTLTVTDASGNSNDCTFNVVDQTAPVVTCPASQQVGVNASCAFTLVNYTLSATATDNCGSVSMVQSPAIGSVITSATPVTITAEDQYGNTSSCTFTLTPIDNVAPSISCIGNQTAFYNANCEFEVANYVGQIVSTDNCDLSVDIVQSPAAGSFVSGVTPITMTGADDAGNSISCTFSVTPSDNQPPSITCPSTQDADFDANCEFALQDYTGLGVAVDNCSATTITQSPVAGTVLSANSVITLTAMDQNQNATSCSFLVVPEDNLAPAIICPSDLTVDFDANCSLTLTDYTGLGSPSDNCSSVFTVSQLPSAGTVIGASTPITLTVLDGNGNSADCSFNVNPVDNTDPIITCIADQEVVFDSNCQFEVSDYNGSAITSDNCSSTITVSQSPAAGTFITGSQVITLTANDGNGNTATCQFSVVPSDEADPVLTCPADQDVSLGQSCGFALLDYTTMASASDNCGSVTLSQDIAAGTIISDTVTVTITAVDVSGNTVSCSFDVNPSDNTSPTAICPGNQLVSLDGNCEFILPNYKNDVVRDDNCGSTTITQSPDLGTAITVQTEIVITVTDDNNNSVTCSFQVIPSDTEAPTISCPVNQTVDVDANCQFELTDYSAEATASDNCTTPLVMAQFPPAGTFIVSATVVTMSVEDAAGNPGQCSFVVLPEDNTDPVIVQCPSDQFASLSASCALAMPDFTGLIQATDNCDVSIEYGQLPLAGSAVAGVGTYAITIGAVDDAGNFTLCEFDLIVTDDADPMVNCPPDQTINLNANCEFAVPDFTALSTASDACGSVTLTQSPLAGSVITGQLNATVIAEDENGNTATCTFFVEVVEMQATATSVSATCTGGSNGTATVTVVGGTAPYTQNWGGFNPSALSAGTYAVTVTDVNGCSTTASVTVADGPLFEIEIDPSGLVQVCEGESVVLNAGSGYAVYAWSTGASVQSITVSNEAVYWVTVTNANGCTSNTDTVQLEFYNAVSPTILSTTDGIISCSNDTASTYQWYLNGSPISGATNSYLCPTVSGNYYVVITDSYGCTVTSVTEEYTYDDNSPCATGIQEHGLSLDVYPNPSTGVFSVTYALDKLTDMELTVYDQLGKQVTKSVVLSALNGTTVIDLASQAEGVYTLRIALGTDKVLQQRLVLVK